MWLELNFLDCAVFYSWVHQCFFNLSCLECLAGLHSLWQGLWNAELMDLLSLAGVCQPEAASQRGYPPGTSFMEVLRFSVS